MNATRTKLMRTAWWRFLALAVIGGTIASNLVRYSLAWIVDREVAALFGSAASLFVAYYSFRECVVALYQDLDAASLARASIETSAAAPSTDRPGGSPLRSAHLGLLVGLAGLLLVGHLAWKWSRPIIPSSAYERLQIGAPVNVVANILGVPHTATTEADGTETWTYRAFLRSDVQVRLRDAKLVEIVDESTRRD